MKNSYYNHSELAKIGLKCFGQNVLISRKASIYNPEVISMGNNVRVDDFCILSGGKYIKLGSFVHIGAYSALFGGGGIELEDFTGMSPRCILHSENDDFLGRSLTGPTIPRKYKTHLKSSPIIFRKHSGIGSACTVLPGVELGQGAIIGAHSMVVKNCDSWSIYAGSPAQRKMRRSRKMLELESQLLDDLKSFQQINSKSRLHEKASI
jgi:galactoside O-acetyltransferase